MKVIELGSYVVPAYAGMILAEQGFQVEKWHMGTDPILGLHQGEELWEWINFHKSLVHRHASEITTLEAWDAPVVVIDNLRPSTLEKWGIDPVALAEKMSCVWVSMRSEVGEISFDLVAQCRSWAEYGEVVPFYAGDTTGGLWMAFKAISMLTTGKIGHFVLGQASCMQKLVEGELAVIPDRIRWKQTAWDEPGTYTFDPYSDCGNVTFRGKQYSEPVRNLAWKRDNLWHNEGRIRI